MKLSDLRTLGRSGLTVSPLALGTMTFGHGQWGSAEELSAEIFDAYFADGGNFIDTADVYSAGRSEELLGGFIASRSLRDKLVLATKFSFNGDKGNPLAGGNGRKNLHRALEGSLRRLKTDYIDLYWMHVWDKVTPVEEMVQSLGDLVRAGKIRYYGFSDVPAWYATRAVSIAQQHNTPAPIALQLEYSLAERSIEREHVPASLELGLGITPWSPLAAGFLSGKYSRDASGKPTTGGGRLDMATQFRKFTDRNWKILDAVRAVSADTGKSAAQVSLAWASAQPGVTSLIIGASKIEQLRDNLQSLELVLSHAQRARLDEPSALDPAHPYSIFSADVNRGIFGGATVTGWK